jgi:hypothetical protein
MKARCIWAGLVAAAVATLFFSRYPRNSTHLSKRFPAANALHDPGAPDLTAEEVAHTGLHARAKPMEVATNDWRFQLRLLFERSPYDAWEWVEHIDTTNRADGETLLAAYWMSTAPEDAIGAAARFDVRAKRDCYINTLAAYPGLTLEECARITEQVAGRDEEILKSWTQAVASRWMQSDLSSVLDWAENSSPVIKTEILIKALPYLARTDPEAAARYYESQATALPGDTRRRIGVEWAARDGEAALKWLYQTGGGEVAIRTALTA